MSADPALHTIDLTGAWEATQFPDGATASGTPSAPADGWFTADVPGALQYDLIRHGKLANPYASSAAVQAAEWVHKSDWLLRRSFDFDPTLAAGSDLVLEADGIDTFADIFLNGTQVGATANAYRAYRFTLDQALLKKGANELVIHVKPHFRMVEHLVAEARQRLGPTFKYKGLIRRYQRSFFTGSSLLNLGGEVLGIGIYKPIRLRVLPRSRVATLHFETRSAAAARAEVAVHTTLAGGPAKVTATLSELDSGKVVASGSSDSGTIALSVTNPRLWWPRGYGAQDRYRLRVDVDGGGTEERLVGIRTASLLKRLPNGRETFQVVVNGTPIHCRGHNIVPVDYIKVHGSRSAYDNLLRLTADSNSNMLRIWGGGGIESPEFYEACDARGIMIWQDFYLHSNTYPDYDEAWVAEFRAESEELLVWLRNHPSLILICGGNEQYEGWDEWGWRGQLDRFYGQSLTEEVLPEVSARLAPELPYIINSPHSGNSSQTPATGDVHNWGNFYNSTKDPLFVTETCWSQESYSRPETLEEMMGIDLDAFNDIGWTQKWKDLTGLNLITRLPYIGGPLPCRTLRDYLRGADLEQAMADHHALTNLLMRSPNLNGLLYWPLNKGGPLFQFGCVDYLGRPLASYYVVKRLFADHVVTIYRDISDIRVIAANRTAAPVDAQLRISHRKLDGAIVHEWARTVSVAPGAPQRLENLDGYYDTIVDRTSEVMKAELVIGGRIVSEETLFFVPLMEVPVRDNAIDARVSKQSEGRWTIELSAGSLVKLIIAESRHKVLFSDNYFTLAPQSPRQISVELLEPAGSAPVTISIGGMDSAERHKLVLQ